MSKNGEWVIPPEFQRASVLRQANVRHSNSSKPQPQEKLTMHDILSALEATPGAPIMTSNMCHAIAQQLNAKLEGKV